MAFKIHQNAFPAGGAPDSAGGAHDAPPNPIVGWGRDTIFPPSALATKTRHLRRFGLAGGGIFLQNSA